MEFYFPDSQDQVDPGFDFDAEQRSALRVRQRDDRYAHEMLDHPPYDGLLISKSVVDGVRGAGTKYSAANRMRLYREGAKQFFRLNRNSGRDLKIMGDCGAFTYAGEHEPVYTVEEVLDFYQNCGLDIGISMDHLIFGYDAGLDHKSLQDVPGDWQRRQNLTNSLAGHFLRLHTTRRCSFEPVAVAHGWSPLSYAAAARKLQSIGYRHLALGGMVKLKTADIHETLKKVATVLEPGTRLHLLGVARLSHINDFAALKVTSFDSTSPFRQAFLSDKGNYHTLDDRYTAIRVPQVDGNHKLRKRVEAGEIDQTAARRLERLCLDMLRGYDRGRESAQSALEAVTSYAGLLGGEDRSADYLRTLQAEPWKHCRCRICNEIGVDVVIFRGAERNRRRGFHNLDVFADQVRGKLAAAAG